jgi:hypothetical protein
MLARTPGAAATIGSTPPAALLMIACDVSNKRWRFSDISSPRAPFAAPAAALDHAGRGADRSSWRGAARFHALVNMSPLSFFLWSICFSRKRFSWHFALHD